MLFRHHYFVGPLTQAGWIGVDLFFVLSGFLISRLLFAELEATRDICVGRFLLRRGFKIYPSFYVFLVVSAVFYNRDTAAITTEAVFLQNYASLTGGRVWYHTWSLAVEEHFYILLPLALLLAARRRTPGAREFLTLFAVVAAGCAALRAANCVANPVVAFTTHYEATHLRIDTLFTGVVLGYLHQYRRAFLADRVHRHRRLLVVAAVVLAAPPFVVPPENPWMNVVGTAGLYVAFGILLALVLFEVPMPRWLDASRGGRELLRVGTDSYNIYLWHVFVLEVMGPLWRATATSIPIIGSQGASLVIYLVLSIGIGHLATIVVEEPMLRLRDRLVPRRQPVRPSV